jgi:hypothetical protein
LATVDSPLIKWTGTVYFSLGAVFIIHNILEPTTGVTLSRLRGSPSSTVASRVTPQSYFLL